MVQAILNHKDRSVTAVYDRYGMDREKEEALTAWGRQVEAIVRPGGQGAVVPFPVRRVTGAGEDDVERGRSDRGRPS